MDVLLLQTLACASAVRLVWKLDDPLLDPVQGLLDLCALCSIVLVTSAGDPQYVGLLLTGPLEEPEDLELSHVFENLWSGRYLTHVIRVDWARSSASRFVDGEVVDG